MADDVDIHFDHDALLRLVHSDEAAKELERRAIRVETAAKRLAPVDTGRLRASITHAMGEDSEGRFVDIGSNVDYACVFGAHTSVTTEAGPRTIGQVRAGERVLTATGEWREVLKATRFPVVEKPDLVTLRVPWRADRSHELTVTEDHKVAVQRIDGRVTWLPAAAVIPGEDRLFHRRKQAHNRGMGRVLVCRWCGGDFSGQNIHDGRVYCSMACKTEAWGAGANPHVGMKRSDEARSRMSEAAIGRPINHLAAWHRHNGGTSLERQVAAWLDDRGVIYEQNWMVGDRHFVDFWLPETGEVIEADGSYWHRDQQRDIERDRRLREHLPGARILHLHFYDPRWTPVLDPEPLPGVQYQIVNPVASHFVDPDVFEAVPVEVERWTWRQSTTPKASKVPNLFDLSVEGVHSFVAGGLLISNSYQEFGTRFQPGTPFLRPALPAGGDKGAA